MNVCNKPICFLKKMHYDLNSSMKKIKNKLFFDFVIGF